VTQETTDRVAGRSRLPSDVSAVLDLACEVAGYPKGGRLLRHFANAVYLLDHAPVVARVSYMVDAAQRARTSLAVVDWLVAQGFPATETAAVPSRATQPIALQHDGHEVAVTFWKYYPQPEGRPTPDTQVLGRIARDLHERPMPSVELKEYMPLRSLAAALADPASEQALPSDERSWLLQRIADLRLAFNELRFPLGCGFIHADLYTGNLLWDASSLGGVVLGDWDSVATGPREVDLIATYHEPHFGEPVETVDAFADAYGYDLRTWSGYQTLYDIRELSTLTALVQFAPRFARLGRRAAPSAANTTKW
jgi:Phosphotransferase enzyme family